MRRLFILLVLLCTLPVFIYAKEYKVVTFTTETAGTVEFNHDVHLARLGKSCTTCHNSLYNVVKKNPPVTMAEMEKGKSCGACHDKKKAFALADCVRCHRVKEVPIEIADFGAVVFSHNFHLGMYSCGECHNRLFKASSDNPPVSMAQMERGASCGACHDGKSAFTVKENCTKCHTVKDIPFSADAQFSHKVHLAMYGCGDCHSKLFVAGPNSKRYTMQEMANGRSCGACHDGKTGFSVLGDCGKCHKGVKEVSFKASDALFSHKFHLTIYRCADCHSGIFVGGVGSKRYTMADMEKSRSCGACHDSSIAFSVAGSCNRCHTSTKEITFDIKDAGKVTFSHDFHKGMYACGDCHNKVFRTGSESRRYSMAEMEKGQSCGACHNGKTAFTVAGNCGKCHPVKDITFTDDAAFSHTKHLEMYKCADCHNQLFKAGPDNKRHTMGEMEKGASCGACHDGNTGFSVKGDCNRCHKTTIEVTFKVPETGATLFSHKFHTGMYKCTDCHNSIFATGKAAKRYKMADMEQGRSCGACHDAKTAFSVKENCEKCHPVKELRFKESGAFFSHKFHIAAYSCNNCHDKIFSPGLATRRATMPDMEKGKSCGACHDGKSAFTSSENCEKCHTVTKAVRYEIPGMVGNALFSHKVHLGRGYNCADCHKKLIPTGVERRPVTMKQMEEGKSCGTCHGFSMAFSVKDQNSCDRCHQRRFVPEK